MQAVRFSYCRDLYVFHRTHFQRSHDFQVRNRVYASLYHFNILHLFWSIILISLLKCCLHHCWPYMLVHKSDSIKPPNDTLSHHWIKEIFTKHWCGRPKVKMLQWPVKKMHACMHGLRCPRCAPAERPVIRLSAWAFHFPLCPRSVAPRSLNCVFIWLNLTRTGQ